MTKPNEDPIILPPGPVDFDKLSAALRKGADHEKAIEAATKDTPKLEEVDMEAVEAERRAAIAKMQEAPAETNEVAKPSAAAAGKE